MELDQQTSETGESFLRKLCAIVPRSIQSTNYELYIRYRFREFVIVATEQEVRWRHGKRH